MEERQNPNRTKEINYLVTGRQGTERERKITNKNGEALRASRREEGQLTNLQVPRKCMEVLLGEGR